MRPRPTAAFPLLAVALLALGGLTALSPEAEATTHCYVWEVDHYEQVPTGTDCWIAAAAITDPPAAAAILCAAPACGQAVAYVGDWTFANACASTDWARSGYDATCAAAGVQRSGDTVRVDACQSDWNSYGGHQGTCQAVLVGASTGGVGVATCSAPYPNPYYGEAMAYTCSNVAGANTEYACVAGVCQRYLDACVSLTTCGSTKACVAVAGCSGSTVCVTAGSCSGAVACVAPMDCSNDTVCVSDTTCSYATVCVSAEDCLRPGTACVAVGDCTCATPYSWSCYYRDPLVCVSAGACGQEADNDLCLPAMDCWDGACVALEGCSSHGSTYAEPDTDDPGFEAATCYPWPFGTFCYIFTADADSGTACYIQGRGATPPTVCVQASELAATAFDADRDGVSNADEATGYSDPTNPASTPWTDDDCDGRANAAEADFASAQGVAHPVVTVTGGGIVFDPVTFDLAIDPPTVGVHNEGASSC